MAIPGHVLVHTAVPLGYDEPQTPAPEWLEGEPGAQGGGEPAQGAAFACVLFLPSPGGEQDTATRRRVVQVPTLLYNVRRADGSMVVLERESDLLITAAELAPWTGAETVRWTLEGDAQPFGPPGSVVGVQAQLRRVQD